MPIISETTLDNPKYSDLELDLFLALAQAKAQNNAAQQKLIDARNRLVTMYSEDVANEILGYQ